MLISNPRNSSIGEELVQPRKMPGHVKRGGTGEPDPDPSPFLFVSWEDKQKDLAKVI